MVEYTVELDVLIKKLCETEGISKLVLIDLVEMSIQYGIEIGEQNVIDSPLDYLDLSEYAPERE